MDRRKFLTLGAISGAAAALPAGARAAALADELERRGGTPQKIMVSINADGLISEDWIQHLRAAFEHGDLVLFGPESRQGQALR